MADEAGTVEPILVFVALVHVVAVLIGVIVMWAMVGPLAAVGLFIGASVFWVFWVKGHIAAEQEKVRSAATQEKARSAAAFTDPRQP